MKRTLKGLVAAILTIAMVFGLVPMMSQKAEAASVTVTFDYGAGVSSPYNGVKTETKTISSGKVKMPAPYRPSDVDFLGWSTTKWGAVKYEYNKTYSLSGNVTLYARYKCNSKHYSVSQQVVRNATCTTNGVVHKTCNYCGKGWDETIKATGSHSYTIKNYNGIAAVVCKTCNSRSYKAVTLDEYAKYWNGANKKLTDYTAAQQEDIRTSWVSFNGNITIDEAKKAEAVYVTAKNKSILNKLGLEPKKGNQDKIALLMKGLNKAQGLKGFGDLAGCSSVIKRGLIIYTLTNPNSTVEEKYTVIKYINPTAGTILNSYEKLYKCMEQMVLIDITRTQLASLKSQDIYNATNGKYDYDTITLEAFIDYLDPICKEMTVGKGEVGYAQIYEKRGGGLRNEYYRGEYEAIQKMVMYLMNKEFKAAFPNYNGTIKDYMKEAQKTK